MYASLLADRRSGSENGVSSGAGPWLAGASRGPRRFVTARPSEPLAGYRTTRSSPRGARRGASPPASRISLSARASRKDRNVETSPLRETPLTANDPRRAVPGRLDRRQTSTCRSRALPTFCVGACVRMAPASLRGVVPIIIGHYRTRVVVSRRQRRDAPRFRQLTRHKNARRPLSRHNTAVPSPWALTSRASPPGTGSPFLSPARPSPRTTWVRTGPRHVRDACILCRSSGRLFATRGVSFPQTLQSRGRTSRAFVPGAGPRGARALACQPRASSDAYPPPVRRPLSHQARSRTGASSTAPATKVAPSSLSSASAR